MRPFGVRWCDPLRARQPDGRERRPGITWGCPCSGSPQTTPISCHFCAMQRDLMCNATYVTWNGSAFAGTVAARPGASRNKSRFFRPNWPIRVAFGAIFEPISGPGCQTPDLNVRAWRPPSPCGRKSGRFTGLPGQRAFAPAPLSPCSRIISPDARAHGGGPLLDRAGGLLGFTLFAACIGNRSTPFRVAVRTRLSAEPAQG
jgi:hypothetical protein